MKKEESAVKMIAKRKVTVDKEVEVDRLTKLIEGDTIKVIIGGKAYNAKVVNNDCYSSDSITITANVSQEASKTWDVLGYDSFEDMIDDMAKEHKHVDEPIKLGQRKTRTFADDKVILSYNNWALRAEFDSKEKADAFLNIIKEEKCFHVETYFDVDQNVYKILVEWEE